MPFRNSVASINGTLVISQLRSQNYVAATSGWQITRDGQAEFQDLVARGTLGVDNISADTISVGGNDLMTLLSQSSIGKLLSARLPDTGAGNIAVTTTNTKVLELNCGTVPGGRTYRVNLKALLYTTGTIAVGERPLFSFRYTTDGSAVTTSSPEMANSYDDWSVPSQQSYVGISIDAEIDISIDSPLKIGVFVYRASGTATQGIYVGSSARSCPIMTLYDDGPLGTRNDSAITLTGGGITRYTKSFTASWIFATNDAGFGGTNSYMVVGNAGGNSSSAPGGNYGLFGFTGISTALAGAVTPISCTLKWKPQYRYTSGGLDTRIVSHNYASRAAAESDIAFPEGGWSSYPLTAMVNVSNTVPNTLYNTSLGTTVFNQFKANTKKGIGFVTQIADTYGLTNDGTGRIYGLGSNAPVLEFVYDGTS